MADPRGDDGPKITVPKFSSFKAAEAVGTEPLRTSTSHEHRKRNQDADKGHHRDRHRSEKSREKGHLAEEDVSRRERPRRNEKRPSSPGRSHNRHKRSRPDAASQESPEHSRSHVGSIGDSQGIDGLYVIDTKGDPLLKKYGNNVHYHVPSSYRYPPGQVLGAEGRLFIHKDGTREEFSILRPGEKPESSRHMDGLRFRWPRAYPNPIRLRPRKKEAEENADDSIFLPIGKPKKRRNVGLQASDTSEDEAGPDYRSIEGKMKARRFGGDESEDDSEPEPDIHQENPLRWRSVQLNKQVKERPEDIDTWLEFVDHQDALLKAGQSIDQSLLENEAHSYAEIKVSLLESALPNARSERDRQRILIPLMREGAKVWDRKTAAKRWADLSEEEQTNFELWKTHLDFCMSDVANFQYDGIRNLLLTRLKFLTTKADSSDPRSRFEEAIYVFLRTTRLIADAGYRELALSAWQALFELNFWCPSMDDSSSTPWALFQEFWESEVPRFGETGAQGWHHFVAMKGAGEAADAPAQAPAHEDEAASRDPYKLWASMEQKRSKEARTPARTLDEGNDDDPFRVVMFSDIEQLVFSIPPNILGDVTEQFIDAFLIFSGLPPAFKSSTWTQLAWKDPCIVAGSSIFQIGRCWEQSIPEGDEVAKRMPLFSGRMLECSLGLDVLVPGNSWFRYLPVRESDASLPWDTVERALKQIIQVRNLGGLGEYLLSFCYVRDPQNIRKQAKALLKQYPTRIPLYVAYAMAEYGNGKNDMAQKTLASAADISSERDLALVLRSWAWIQLENSDRDASLRVLCSIAEPELRKRIEDKGEATSSQLLKAAQAFDSDVYLSMSAGSSDAAALYGECSLLLSYLTSTDSKEPSSAAQGGIEAAMEMARRISAEFSRRSMLHSSGHEKLLQAAARILLRHAANGPFRRAFMHENLMSFVDTFPKNTIFLSLLEWCDSGLRVIDETRQLLQERCLKPAEDSLSTRVFAIQHEIERGNTNSARAAFEDAVNSDACSASPFVWIWYMHFGYSQRTLRQRAKGVFYRALRHCPWSKEVMMQAFTTLIRGMESDELKSVYETMTSKGMRIHIELDDFLLQHEAKRARERGRR